MSLIKLRTIRPDRSISALCHRGSHEDSLVKNKCKGRSCRCDCHPLNKQIPFCIICDNRRTDKQDQVCKICSGKV